MGKLSDNVMRESSGKTVKLACGHSTTQTPIVIYPGGRKSYQCPQGCGLQKGRGR